jgi:hypothetical protein
LFVLLSPFDFEPILLQAAFHLRFPFVYGLALILSTSSILPFIFFTLLIHFIFSSTHQKVVFTLRFLFVSFLVLLLTASTLQALFIF